MVLKYQNCSFEWWDMHKRFVRWSTFTLIFGGGIMFLSGRWADPWLWSYVALWSGLSGYALLSIDEDLARERFHPPSPGEDHLSLRAVRVAAVAHLVVGALDVGRWHLAPVGPSLRAVGLVLMLLSGLLVFRAMLTNRFFSAVVRIQVDRGHHVVDRGLYSVIRHPGYAGMIVVAPASALALGSWISVVMALVYSAFIVRRVLFEDAYLRANLEGYEAYTRRVPYRLIPRAF
jgi:protein-S-isoprenylcysteine O-methyltransferase Ste14